MKTKRMIETTITTLASIVLYPSKCNFDRYQPKKSFSDEASQPRKTISDSANQAAKSPRSGCHTSHKQ